VRKLRAILFSIPAIILATVVMATVSLITSIWDRSGATQHAVARAWSRMLLALGFVKIRVFGIEKLDPGRSYVLVSNHASYMDTPAVLSSVPLEFRFFAKKGLFSIPFLGWHLQRAGHLPVVRGDARASLKTMSEGAKLVRERKVSLLLFPEGGRSEKRMRPFHEGAAYIAIKAGVPAVPIGLVNTRRVLPMHSGVIRPGTIEVHVGDPIETTGMALRDREKLNAELQQRVAELAGEEGIASEEPSGIGQVVETPGKTAI
jgi:1-acyl-sn-glycerol-3-phosphate acyltransferase